MQCTQHGGDDYDKIIRGDPGLESIYNWTKAGPTVAFRGRTGKGDGVHVLTGELCINAPKLSHNRWSWLVTTQSSKCDICMSILLLHILNPGSQDLQRMCLQCSKKFQRFQRRSVPWL